MIIIQSKTGINITIDSAKSQITAQWANWSHQWSYEICFVGAHSVLLKLAPREYIHLDARVTYVNPPREITQYYEHDANYNHSYARDENGDYYLFEDSVILHNVASATNLREEFNKRLTRARERVALNVPYEILFASTAHVIVRMSDGALQCIERGGAAREIDESAQSALQEQSRALFTIIQKIT